MEAFWTKVRRDHPGWTFDLELVPGRTEQILQKLMVVRASGGGPDLACIRMEWVGPLLRRDLLQPLSEPFSATVRDALLPALRGCGDREGKTWLVPYDIGIRVILYRADLFAAAGIPEPTPTWTWDDMVRAARALTVDLDGDGRIDRWGLGIPAARSQRAVLQWLPWFWSLGGNLKGPDGRLTILSPASIEVMRWYRDLAFRHRVTPPSLYSLDQDAVFQGLASGLFAMTEGGSWEIDLLGRYSTYQDRIRIALLPGPDPNRRSITLADGWGFGILSRDERKRELIERILPGLCTTRHQLEKYRASDMLSPFREVYRDPLFTEDRTGRILAEAVRRSRPLPPVEAFSTVSEAIEIALQKVLMDGAEPAEALAAEDRRLRRPGSASSRDETKTITPAQSPGRGEARGRDRTPPRRKP